MESEQAPLDDNSKVIEKQKDTFNRLKEFQSLLKKESALKELCKK